MKQIIVNVPPFSTWTDARNMLQKTLKDIVEQLVQGMQEGQIDGQGLTVVQVADPVNPQDAATKNYVDSTFKATVVPRSSIGSNEFISGPLTTSNVIPVILGSNSLGESSLSDNGSIVETSEDFKAGFINGTTGFAFNGTSGATGTASLAKLTGGGVNGSLLVRGGLIVLINNPT